MPPTDVAPALTTASSRLAEAVERIDAGLDDVADHVASWHALAVDPVHVLAQVEAGRADRLVRDLLAREAPPRTFSIARALSFCAWSGLAARVSVASDTKARSGARLTIARPLVTTVGGSGPRGG